MPPEPLAEKLKSWTRWGAVLAAIAPILVQGLTGEIGWLEALVASLVAGLVGLGLINRRDVARLRLGGELASADAARTIAAAARPTAPPPE